MQVFMMFDADAQSDELVIDAKLGALLSRDGGVGHDGRVLYEALDATEALGQSEELDRGQEASSVLQVASELDGDHATARLHLALGQVKLGMGLEARVTDALHPGVGFEEGGDLGGVVAMALHP